MQVRPIICYNFIPGNRGGALKAAVITLPNEFYDKNIKTKNRGIKKGPGC